MRSLARICGAAPSSEGMYAARVLPRALLTEKLPEGGWFPLLIGGAIFMMMLTWKEGRRLMGEVQRCPLYTSRCV